jgi:hypothetical protein
MSFRAERPRQARRQESDAIESQIRNAIHTAFIKYPDPEGGPQLDLEWDRAREKRPRCQGHPSGPGVERVSGREDDAGLNRACSIASAGVELQRLNREDVPNHLGRPWTRSMVNYILRNEHYIGNTVYNRESRPLRDRKIKNPPNLWIRTKGSLAATVDQDVFLRAQERLTLRWQHLSDDELLSRLKSLLKKEGRLTVQIINDTLGVPSINVYSERFGSLRKAYRRIGYRQKWDFDWIDRRSEFNVLLRETATALIARLQKAGSIARFEPGVDVLTVNNRFAISLRLARSWLVSGRNPIWTVNRRISLPGGHIIAIRLGEGNKSVLDYLLLPTSEMTGQKIRFMEVGLRRFDGRRFRNSAHLAKAVLHQIVQRTPTHNTAINASEAKLSRPKGVQAKGRSKGRTGRGRR